MSRQPGYYWVSLAGGEPHVAEYSPGFDGLGEWRIQGEWHGRAFVVVLSERLLPPSSQHKLPT